MNWINVKDKLPKRSEIVLAYGQYKDKIHENDPDQNYYVRQVKFYPDEEWAPYLTWDITFDCLEKNDYCSRCEDVNFVNVTHWMPLPSSPEDEKWISIEEKLPEFDQLIVGTDGKYESKMYRERFTLNEYIWVSTLSEEITHWMPLLEEANEVD